MKNIRVTLKHCQFTHSDQPQVKSDECKYNFVKLLENLWLNRDQRMQLEEVMERRSGGDLKTYEQATEKNWPYRTQIVRYLYSTQNISIHLFRRSYQISAGRKGSGGRESGNAGEMRNGR